MAGVPGVPVPVWWPARAHTQQARGGWDRPWQCHWQCSLVWGTGS